MEIITHPSDTLSAARFQAAAQDQGISPHQLRRYRTARLLAPSDPHGEVPARALDQLAAIAAARRRTKNVRRIRHYQWWSGVALESWEPWRADQLAVLEDLAADQRRAAQLGEEQFAREAQGLARALVANRAAPFPRGEIRNPDDREAAAVMLLQMYARKLPDLLYTLDPQTLTTASPAAWPGLVRQHFNTPLDDRGGIPAAPGPHRTLGDLYATTWRQRDVEDGATRALLLTAWMPWADELPRAMRALSEARAGELRDLVKAVATTSPEYDLRWRHEIAGFVLLTLDHITTAVPELLTAVPAGLSPSPPRRA